jgi:hypothetical protein
LVNRLNLGLSEQIGAGLREPDERPILVHHQPNGSRRLGLDRYRACSVDFVPV